MWSADALNVELVDESAPSETEKESPQYYSVSHGRVLLESRNCALGYRGLGPSPSPQPWGLWISEN